MFVGWDSACPQGVSPVKTIVVSILCGCKSVFVKLYHLDPTPRLWEQFLTGPVVPLCYIVAYILYSDICIL